MRSGRVRYRDGLLGHYIGIAQAALAFLGTLAALVCHAADSPATSGAGVTGATVRLLVHDTLTRQIELVVARPEIGRAIDRNKRERVHIDDSELRNLVVRRAQVALPQEGVQVEALSATGDAAAASDNTDSGEIADDRLAALVSAARGRDARWLLLVSPLRGQAMLRRARSHVGHGAVEGVGFYVDANARFPNRVARPYVACYAYVRVQLVDVQLGKIVADEWEHESSSRSLSGRDTSFDAMTPEQRSKWLRAVLRAALDRALPKVASAVRG